MFSFSYLLITFFSLGARAKRSSCKVSCLRRIAKTIKLDCAVQIFNTFENLDHRRIDGGLSTLSFQGLATSRCKAEVWLHWSYLLHALYDEQILELVPHSVR